MNKFFVLFSLTLVCLPIFPQQLSEQQALRYIEVSGTSEIELAPNEFYISILAREYLDSNKKKVTIDELERQVKDAVVRANVPIENMSISDIESALSRYKRKKDKDLFLSKTYLLKITSAAQIEPLLNNLSAVELQDVDLAKTSHTEIQKYRLEVKVAAVEAARQKAESMLAPLAAKLGKVIYVQELADDLIPPVYNRAENNKMSNSLFLFENEPSSPGNAIGFKNIKLKYSVTVRFEISQ